MLALVVLAVVAITAGAAVHLLDRARSGR